jgi:hypothetical protein
VFVTTFCYPLQSVCNDILLPITNAFVVSLQSVVTTFCYPLQTRL